MVEARNNEQRILYLTCCDQHGRSFEGVPMVAGKTFMAPQGYPALPWGCGPLLRLRASAPRWLVLDAEDIESRSGQCLVKSATILLDGHRSDALRYLHEHGASGMPYIGRRRRGTDFAVLTVGSAGEVAVDDHGIVAAGQGSTLAAGAALVAGVGPNAAVQAAEFARIAGADQVTVAAERFAHVAVGTGSEVTVGAGGYVVVGTDTSCTAGPGSYVLSVGGGRIDLGERATGMGTRSTQFRGAAGALFLVVETVDTGDVIRSARVGLGGIQAHQWYQCKGGAFEMVP